jgi:hypothetical protein
MATSCKLQASGSLEQLKATSGKLQAASLTTGLGYCKIIIERNIMEKEVNGHLYIANDNLKRIADALDEILRLVKKDMEKYEEKKNKK